MKKLALVLSFLSSCCLWAQTANNFNGVRRTELRQTDCEPDSMTYYHWDSPSNSWLVNYDLFYTYDLLGRETQMIERNWYNGKPRAFYRNRYSYNTNGMDYDTLVSYGSDDSISWTEMNRSFRSDDGMMLTFQTMDRNLNSWVNQTVYKFTMVNNRVTIDELSYWIEGTWYVQSRTNYFYDKNGNADSVVVTGWDKSAKKWINSSMEILTFNSLNQIKTKITKFWDFSKNTWYLFDIRKYEYTLGRPLYYMRQTWNLDRQQWEDYEITTYEEVENCRIGTRQVVKDGSWENSVMTRNYLPCLPAIISETGQHEERQIVVWPNPSFDLFYFDGTRQGDEILFYNANGSLVKISHAQESNSSVDLKSESKGVYFYRIVGKNHRAKTGRVILK